MSTWNLDRVEAAFAEAALDPSLWVRALDIVTAETGAHGAVLLPAPDDVLPDMPHTESMAPSADTYFRDGWYRRDERHNAIATMLRTGVADDFDAMSGERMAHHPYYQEFLRPHGLHWFAGVRILCGDKLWVLSIQRTIRQGPFSPAEKERLVRLAHSLPTSVAIARALGAATGASVLDAFELGRTAAVLIDRQGKVIRANASAQALLQGDVRLRGGRIAAADAAATLALDRALHEMIFRRAVAGLAPPVGLPRFGQRPLLAYPGRLPAMAANPLADGQAVVVLVDPDARKRPDAALLRSAFGLTDAEARLAACLGAGEPLDETCDRLRIAKETGRNHLKSIFAKTGTHRQPELVAMLGALLQSRVEPRGA
jgi:DNA-binding CsgD family transcriptional regulator